MFYDCDITRTLNKICIYFMLYFGKILLFCLTVHFKLLEVPRVYSEFKIWKNKTKPHNK